MKNNSRNRHRGGFTLIEVMIVLFILVMIMGLIVVNVQGARNLAQKRTALAYVKTLANQVKRFDADIGRFPTTEEGIAALLTCPSSVSEGKWGGPYLEETATDIDPWGNPYQYACPGRHGSFDIWSYGPNMMDEGGEGDDIGSWMNDL